ncbi:hypothetical protein D3C76_1424700 [compost metagenome]
MANSFHSSERWYITLSAGSGSLDSMLRFFSWTGRPFAPITGCSCQSVLMCSKRIPGVTVQLPTSILSSR